MKHYYDGKEDSGHLPHRNGGPISAARYWFWSSKMKGKFLDLYMAKLWGPPYYKTKKTFKELPGGAKPAEKAASS